MAVIITARRRETARPSFEDRAMTASIATPHNRVSPYRRYGWFRNPFGELTQGERAQLAVIDWDDWIETIGHSRTVIQFIGDCGRGKTTRMLAIANRFADSVYVYLPEDGTIPVIAHGSPLLIDEAQRLPGSIRRSILSTGISLVLATHRDLTRPLRRFGYSVKTYRIGDQNDAALVHKILSARIESSTFDHTLSPKLSAADSDRLWQRFGSDIRGLEQFLYTRIQTQIMAHGEVRFID